MFDTAVSEKYTEPELEGLNAPYLRRSQPGPVGCMLALRHGRRGRLQHRPRVAGAGRGGHDAEHAGDVLQRQWRADELRRAEFSAARRRGLDVGEGYARAGGDEVAGTSEAGNEDVAGDAGDRRVSDVRLRRGRICISPWRT